MSCPNCGKYGDFDRTVTAWICNNCGFEIPDKMSDSRSSMLYWYPKVRDLPIPQPRTEILEIRASEEDWYNYIDGQGPPPFDINSLKALCRKIGYPIFLRTDQTSGKHFWRDACYVANESKLKGNLFRVVESTLGADIIGLSVRSLFVREYIPMMSLFTAFYGEMPVNPEMRCFVREGRMRCCHWYWIEDAIVNPSVENWREILSNYQIENMAMDFMAVRNFARIIAEAFKDDGFWSVDFCKSKTGQWILIDMAEGERSWHPENCKEGDLLK